MSEVLYAPIWMLGRLAGLAIQVADALYRMVSPQVSMWRVKSVAVISDAYALTRQLWVLSMSSWFSQTVILGGAAYDLANWILRDVAC